MSAPQAHGLLTRPGRTRVSGARGFSLIDVLVSMAVVAVLIAMMMPSLSSVRESARRVVCASNVRQIGLGLAMYADDYKGLLPPSKFANPALRRLYQPQQMMVVRTNDTEVSAWDGLGWLFVSGYLEAPGVFYCPSHHGDHPYSRYAQGWSEDHGEIVANYQFRGRSTLEINHELAMVADGIRSQSDFNHKVGTNVLRADLTVSWFSTPDLAANLPHSAEDPAATQKVQDAWSAIDQGARSN